MRVLLIRRREASEKTALRLRERGHEPVVFPLTERVSLAPSNRKVADVGIPDFLLFTSASGVQCHDVNHAWLQGRVPVYAVGPRTNEQLKQLGYKNIHQGPGDAAGLAAKIISDFQGRTAEGLYFSGTRRSFDFDAALAETGITLATLEVYRMGDLEPDCDRLHTLMNSAEKTCVLIYSPHSARSFSDLLAECDYASAIPDLSVIAISRKAAEELDSGMFSRILVAAEPNEEGLLSTLDVLQREIG